MKSFFVRGIRMLPAAALAAGLAGCASGNAELAPNERQSGDSVVRLTLAVQTYAEDKTLADWISRFNAGHPGIEVQLMSLPRDQYDKFLNMRMTSDEGPDVFQISTGWLTPYIYKNYLLDLSEVVDDAFKVAFPQWASDYTKNKDHYYAIPSDMMTVRLIYNKDLMSAAGLDPDLPPRTWDQLREYADRITEASTGYYKYGFALPAGDDETFRKALEIAGTASGAYYFDFATGKYGFDVYEPWFRTMLAMKEEGGLFPGETSLQTDTALTQFAQGNIGMMIVSNHDFALLSRMKAPSFSLGIAMPPLTELADAGKGALMLYPEPPVVINAYTAHPAEALELWEFLLSAEYLGEMYKLGGSIPTREGITGNPAYRPQQPQIQAFLPTGQESPYPREPKFILQSAQTPFSPKNLGDSERMKTYREILQGLRGPGETLHSLTDQYNKSLENQISRQLISMQDFVFPSFDPRRPLAENAVENQRSP
ncbi:ABC transporter substrate-binding protein [Cohnella sp. 56]|uniref:ABC transporter substrate-binding protein n=1 Tax=Cohnella sp. 56 TaxID=3113722 RepID=UPI0030E85A0D